MAEAPRNIDQATVAGFGEEWATFDQVELEPGERQRLFDEYFSIFPWHRLPADATGFDMGCGSGRWAMLVAPRVGSLTCIDPAGKALAVAKRALRGATNVRFIEADVDGNPLADASQDFGYSLGVLHHVPDTAGALGACTAKLKPGAPFLLYLYYAFDQRPAWFRGLWRASDVGRRLISRMPFGARKLVSGAIAAAVYWPLARGAAVAERLGANVENAPLGAYRRLSYYTMRTDALDRFGTRLEQRFTRAQIDRMMTAAGLTEISFRDSAPFWIACGIKG